MQWASSDCTQKLYAPYEKKSIEYFRKGYSIKDSFSSLELKIAPELYYYIQKFF